MVGHWWKQKNVFLFLFCIVIVLLQEPECQQNDEIGNVPENLDQDDYQQMENDNSLYDGYEGENTYDQGDESESQKECVEEEEVTETSAQEENVDYFDLSQKENSMVRNMQNVHEKLSSTRVYEHPP